MINTVKHFLGFGQCNPREGTTIVINSEKLERRVALLEDGVLEEYSIEREGEDNIVGGIFKGRVKNIEPGLKAMFVDIGYEKNAFLQQGDAAFQFLRIDDDGRALLRVALSEPEEVFDAINHFGNK